MKIELKNINYKLSFYDQYPPYQAELFIDRHLAGIVQNEGYGNACEYKAINNEGRLLIRDAELYCKTLPDLKYGSAHGDGDIILQSSLTLELDRTFEKYLIESQVVTPAQRAHRHMLKEITYGYPGRNGIMGWDFSIPLARILANPAGEEIVKEALKKYVLPRLKNGMAVFNTNIAEKIFIEAGLRPNQYKVGIENPVKKPHKGKKL
jgi:hypothetical protein